VGVYLNTYMQDIYEYILQLQSERQKHLRLDDLCIERGSSNSFMFKGLLAHFLDTTIPQGKWIFVCHACHNAKCCNPYHLYWGTPKENKMDEIDNGGTNIWQRMVAKYGLEEARDIQRRKNTSRAGKGNIGKAKSEEHRRQLSIAAKKAWDEKKSIKISPDGVTAAASD
jgi:hypothetical protein